MENALNKVKVNFLELLKGLGVLPSPVSPLPDSPAMAVGKTTRAVGGQIAEDIGQGIGSLQAVNPLYQATAFTKALKGNEEAVPEMQREMINVAKPMSYVAAPEMVAVMTALGLGGQALQGQRPLDRGDYAENIADTMSESAKTALLLKIIGMGGKGLNWKPANKSWVTRESMPTWLYDLLNKVKGPTINTMYRK